MKTITKIFCLLTCLWLIIGCKDSNNVTPIIPSEISNITAEAFEGSVLLKWDNPEDKNFFYVKTTYHDPRTNEDVQKVTSIYSDTLRIDNMLNKYGEYTFNLQVVSETGNVGEVHTISAQCLKVPPTYTITGEQQIALKESQLSANYTQEPDGVAKLIDGNENSFFHSQWSPSADLPHWIDISLENEVSGFKFWYKTRHDNGNGCPSIIEVLISEDNVNWTSVSTIASGLPDVKAKDYTSKSFLFSPLKAKYVRLSVNKGAGTGKFFAMAELKAWECFIGEFDPEE